MYEGANFNLGGPDFGDLAPKPPKTPEFKKNDDDDLEEDKEKPKTLLEILKKNTEVIKEDSKKPEKESEKPEKTEDDPEEQEPEIVEDENASTEDGELESDKPEMSAEEEQEISSAILENRQEEIHNEAESAQTTDAQDEALAAGVFVEATKQAVDEGMPVDEAIENGRAVAIEALELEVPKVETGPDYEPEPTPEAEPETESEPETTDPEAEIPDPVEIDPALDEEDPVTSTTATVPPVPPVPPIPPIPMGGGPGFGPGHSPSTPDVVPFTSTESKTDTEDYGNRRHGHAKYVLAGGIVGYLLGRRRGRIKTEKKLLPVQRKLEKEVADLHGKLAWHEASVRSMVQEQLAKKPEAIERKAETEKIEKKQKSEQNKNQYSHEHDPKQLGKFGLVGERSFKSEKFKTSEKLKTVDLMTVPELLNIAEKIEIENSTIKKLYESNRLDYEGLRRIVRAYLQGELLDRIVRENLLTPEKYTYPETLQTNSPPASQKNNVVGVDTFNNLNSSENPDPQELANSTSFPADISRYDLYKKNNNPQKYGIAVGAIIAVILLIFIVFR